VVIQARADRTRMAVIDETVRCILDEGYAAASAKHIAERAGVTWGVIQYHFGDREALMMAVVDKGYNELVEALRELPASSAALTARKRTEQVVAAAWDAFSTPTSMAALEILIATRSIRDPAASAHLERIATELARLGKHIGQGLDARHAAAIGNLLWAALRGMVLAQMAVRTPVDTSRERQALVEVIGSYIAHH
jgi:TetR/AcrR family transcriptional regulator, regulator of cefoperazone and chloramphenicol sensitivity